MLCNNNVNNINNNVMFIYILLHFFNIFFIFDFFNIHICISVNKQESRSISNPPGLEGIYNTLNINKNLNKH